MCSPKVEGLCAAALSQNLAVMSRWFSPAVMTLRHIISLSRVNTNLYSAYVTSRLFLFAGAAAASPPCINTGCVTCLRWVFPFSSTEGDHKRPSLQSKRSFTALFSDSKPLFLFIYFFWVEMSTNISLKMDILPNVLLFSNIKERQCFQ